MMVCITILNLKDQKVQRKTSKEQVDFFEQLINKYPIDSIEDGMAENDWMDGK